MTKRVVITGVGAVSAAGNTAAETWDAMVAGRSGIGPVTFFDAERYTSKIQAEVKNFELGDVVDAKQQRHMNRSVQFGMSAAMEALAHSGLKITDDNAEDIGVIFSSGGGGYDALLDGQATLTNRGPRRITPFLVAKLHPGRMQRPHRDRHRRPRAQPRCGCRVRNRRRHDRRGL